MHKTVKGFIFATALPLTVLLGGCASGLNGGPSGHDFLNDAAATCGARELFEDGRTYQMTATATTIDRTYTCVNAYLDHSPEYQAEATDQAADRRLITAMEQIEIARSKGLLTPEQAATQSHTAIAAHGSN